MAPPARPVHATVTLVPSAPSKQPRAAMRPPPYTPIRASAQPLLGLRLRLALLVSESSWGPWIFYSAIARLIPGLWQVVRETSYAEQPRASLLLESWGGGGPACGGEDAVPSRDVHERVAAALHCLGHVGTSKCATAATSRPSVLDYHACYQQGLLTPSDVAERLLAFLARHNERERWLSACRADDVRSQAAAATARYKAGAPLSVFDGAPFVVKDSIDALPYPTTFGTRFMGDLRPAAADAPCVAAMRQLGAVLLGKAALNEFGCFPSGLNTHAGSTRNPHSGERMSGGSSAGSAAAVAVGLCPVAVGTDGGGSIRIPSSLCGVVGLKPTYGRLHHGGGTSSITVLGPIGNSVSDVLLLYAAMANTHHAGSSSSSSNGSGNKADGNPVGSSSSSCGGVQLPASAHAAIAAAAAAGPRPLALPHELLPLPAAAGEGAQEPPVADAQPLQGLRIGVYEPWAHDCAPAVLEVLQASLARLEALGASRVAIQLPELQLAQAGHTVTFATEMTAEAAQQGWLTDWTLRSQLNNDTRMFYSNATNMTSSDYEQAQRMRARVLGHFEAALQECDVILTPATPCTAPKLPEAAATSGVYDLAATLELVRFTQVANLTGLPALAMPAGRALGCSLPVGVQFMGRPWSEALLLRVAAALEQQMFDDGLPHPLPPLLLNPVEGPAGTHPYARQLTQQLWAKKYKSSSSSKAA